MTILSRWLRPLDRVCLRFLPPWRKQLLLHFRTVLKCGSRAIKFEDGVIKLSPTETWNQV